MGVADGLDDLDGMWPTGPEPAAYGKMPGVADGSDRSQDEARCRRAFGLLQLPACRVADVAHLGDMPDLAAVRVRVVVPTECVVRRVSGVVTVAVVRVQLVGTVLARNREDHLAA